MESPSGAVKDPETVLREAGIDVAAIRARFDELVADNPDVVPSVQARLLREFLDKMRETTQGDAK